MNHNSADTALSEILMVSCPIVDLTFRWYLVAWSRISERTSCEESANFLQILHIHPTLKTRISLKKVILTEVPGIRLSSNRSATLIS